MVRPPVTYPTNHLLAVVDDPAAAADVAKRLVAAGFHPKDVTVLRGEEGADRLDGLGDVHRWTRLVRIFQYMTMDQMPDFRTYEAALRDGRAVIAVRVRNRTEMTRARDILVEAGRTS